MASPRKASLWSVLALVAACSSLITPLRALEGVDGYVTVGMWGGLNNQKQCVVPALQLAQRLNYTLVLPYWKLDFLADRHEERGLEPFSFMYKVDPIREYAARYGVRIAERYSDMPEEVLAVCIEQLARHYPGHPIAATKEHWERVLHQLPPADRPRAICLNDLAAIYHTHKVLDNMQVPGLQAGEVPVGGWMDADEIRDALVPSPAFAAEVAKIQAAVQARFGTQDFVALHLRTELDWVHHCTMAPDLPSDRHRCFMDDPEVEAYLTDTEKLPKGALVFVCSDRQELPDMCRTRFTCFRRDDVWADRSPLIEGRLTRETRAFLDYQLALRASAFYGQMFSTFSNELLHTFERSGGHARYYNSACEGRDECRRIPPAFQNAKCSEQGNLDECMHQGRKGRGPSRFLRSRATRNHGGARRQLYQQQREQQEYAPPPDARLGGR